MKRIVAENKEDLWRIPQDSGVLVVKFALSMNGATEIVMKCRELHQLVVDGHVWAGMAQEVKDYLNENVHVAIMGDVEGNGVSVETEKEIRKQYDLGHKSLEQLAREFKLSYEVVKDIIELK